MANAEAPVLKPLNLFEVSPAPTKKQDEGEHGPGGGRVTCLLCENHFHIPDAKDAFLRHLLLTHKFVIADVNIIADLKRYIVYWKRRLIEQPITDFCAVINTNSGEIQTGPQEEYYLLSDVLAEDKDLRLFLQTERLNSVLKCQQDERDDVSFCHACLFCRKQFTGSRAELFNHMNTDHSFNVGQPDNLVYTDEFLVILQDLLNNLKCLYCEKTFKEWTTLKEHMRKKQHRKINSKNRKYDKFYVINYLELGKNWQELEAEEDSGQRDIEDEGNDDEWNDWEEANATHAVCLYCHYTSTHTDMLKQHMKDEHGFDLHDIKLQLNLNFYQKVKLINYIRRQVHLCTCIACSQKFPDKATLLEHMQSQRHTSHVPDVACWDQPQYYFPTYENDTLLYHLEEEEDSDADVTANNDCNHSNQNVIGEDLHVQLDNCNLSSELSSCNKHLTDS